MLHVAGRWMRIDPVTAREQLRDVPGLSQEEREELDEVLAR